LFVSCAFLEGVCCIVQAGALHERIGDDFASTSPKCERRARFPCQLRGHRDGRRSERMRVSGRRHSKQQTGWGKVCCKLVCLLFWRGDKFCVTSTMAAKSLLSARCDLFLGCSPISKRPFVEIDDGLFVGLLEYPNRVALFRNKVVWCVCYQTKSRCLWGPFQRSPPIFDTLDFWDATSKFSCRGFRADMQSVGGDHDARRDHRPASNFESRESCHDQTARRRNAAKVNRVWQSDSKNRLYEETKQSRKDGIII